MNQLEDRIRRELNAAAERIPESSDLVARLQPDTGPHRPMRGPLVGVAAMATVLLVGGMSFVLLRGQANDDLASGSADQLRPTVTLPDAGVTGTTFDGSLGTCSPAVTRGTMYLGGPAWENNLTADGFMLSLPAGPTAADLATMFVSQAIVGDGCEHQITASTQTDLGDGRSAVAVDVVPPATPAALHLTVETAAEDGVIGVIAVRGMTSFDVATSGRDQVLHLQGLPAEAVNVSVRFRKGDDVWELAATADDGDVLLAVPSTETDRFSDARSEWVLFTVQDRNGAVLDVGGALIP